MIHPQRSPSGALSLSISTYRPPLGRVASCSALSCTLPLNLPLVLGEMVRSAMSGPRTPGKEPMRRCAPVGTASSPLNDPSSVSVLPWSVTVTEPLPERSARVPTRRGPGERRTWNVEEAAAPALDRPRKHAPSKNVLAAFSAVLRIGTGLGKIAIRVFKHFILVAVTQLVMKIRPGAAGAFGGFLFDRSLFDIAVRVLLFCHRA